MRAKPSGVESYLQGSASSREERARIKPEAPEQRRQKAVMLTQSVILAVKNEANRRTQESGRRVTESDIYEEAVKALLGLA